MKLGCLPYLNVKPLVYPFEHGGLPEGWQLVYAPPAELARMLALREVVAAPVSTFVLFSYTDLDFCPGICIASDGPVQSVLLLSRKHSEQIRTIAVDSGSLSGANMLRIILKEAHGLEPEFVRLSPEPVSRMLEICDAAMVIGNPAMLYPKNGLHVLDIGEEWRKLTGLPAVFAVWAGRQMHDGLVRMLEIAKQQGLSHLTEIAAEESLKLGLPFDVCYDYLSRTMIYDMGERELRSLELFRAKSVAHGLLDAEVTVR